jgi:succinate dehydrogenase / fumarate reductase cytochrome b subunit
MSSPDRSFWARKLFSFFGIAPITLYVLWHLSNNLYAVNGEAAFDGRLIQFEGNPLYRPLVILLVYLPLLFHALYGLVIGAKSRPNVLLRPAVRNWKYLLQRVSAVGILFFVPAHVYKTKFAVSQISFAHMREGMNEPLTFAVYLLAMLGVSFHLANGVWLAGITWGLWVGPRAQKRAEILSIVFGLVLVAVSFLIIFALRG